MRSFLFFCNQHLLPLQLYHCGFNKGATQRSGCTNEKKSSRSYFTGGGLLHAYVKRKPCCNGRRSRFKSLQVQIRCIKSGDGGERKTRLFLKGLFQTLNVTLGMWSSQVFHLKAVHRVKITTSLPCCGSSFPLMFFN